MHLPLLATFLSGAAHATTPTADDSWLNGADRPVAARLNAEVGFLAPLTHKIQSGTDGTYFDYVADGGQDLLFPVVRLSADADIGRSTVVLLYQPIQINTAVTFYDDVVEDGVTFPAGTAMDLQDGFSFWRGSYLYDLLPDPSRELAIGAGMQIRDADIRFTSADGELRVTNRDVGPVPLLKLRARTPLGKHLWGGVEVDGVYAPVKYLNGADTDVVGALLDASVRGGVALPHGTDLFLNVRYLTGGAEGTDKSPDGLGDGFTKNWLQFLTVSVGATIR